MRKTIVLSMPPSNDTSAALVSSMLDVSEAVRRAAYCVLASKFPLQSLRYYHIFLVTKFLNFNEIMHINCTDSFKTYATVLSLGPLFFRGGCQIGPLQ